VPADTPVTIPVVDPTVATPILPLLHTPPPDTLLSVVVLPEHSVIVPVIDEGVLITLTTRVARQPDPVI